MANDRPISPVPTPGMQLEEEKLNLANNGPKGCDDPFAPALYTSLLATKLIDTASSQCWPGEGGGSRIRVTALRGWGFVIKKRKLKKDDVPDTYCVIRVNKSKEEWKTSTIKDDCMPNWNETCDFAGINPARCSIHVDVYDKNGHRGKDDFVGSARFPVETLLRKRLMELELRSGNARTKSYVRGDSAGVSAPPPSRSRGEKRALLLRTPRYSTPPPFSATAAALSFLLTRRRRW